MSSLETVIAAETQSTTTRPVNVLLLEDAPGDVELFTMFVRGNVTLDVATNGAEALDRLFVVVGLGTYHYPMSCCATLTCRYWTATNC
jgi:hypothetical protein